MVSYTKMNYCIQTISESHHKENIALSFLRYWYLEASEQPERNIIWIEILVNFKFLKIIAEILGSRRHT